MTTYYDILEIPTDASEKDIKTAYKKLALKYHPDKNPENIDECEHKFKIISDAYSVLSDTEKKLEYDNNLKNPQQQQQQQQQQHMNQQQQNFFNTFFGGMGININGMNINGGGQMQNQNLPKRIDPLSVNIYITLRELYFGIQINANIKINCICKNCKGYGATNIEFCDNCGGNGFTRGFIQMGSIIHNIDNPCNRCRGAKRIRQGDACKECNNSGIRVEDKVYGLKIEKGMVFGDVISFDNVNGSREIDFILTLNENNTAEQIKCIRKGNDLLYTYDVLLGDSLSQFNVIINHISGETITYKETNIVFNSFYRKIFKKGMPIRNANKDGNADSYGDLYVIYNVIYPTEPTVLQTNENARDIIKQLLPSDGKCNDKTTRLTENLEIGEFEKKTFNLL